MKLYTFELEGRPRAGAGLGDRIVDLTAGYSAMRKVRLPEPDAPAVLPPDMMALIRGGEPLLKAARAVLEFAARRPALPVGEEIAYPIDQIRILAPLPRPGKILCSGINYRSHAQENPAAKMPAEPFFFAKLPNTVIGPDQPIVRPAMTRQLDYEVELAVVIGARLKLTAPGEVMQRVLGYTLLHDVSARDVQFKDQQITLGKNFDTFCPMGPCILTADDCPAPGAIRLRSFVNDRLMQDGTTADWVFPLPELLSRLSQVMTLEPGDVVSTGTPAGVGVFRKPPVFLQPGDLVRLEADGIGTLSNPVVEE